MNAESKVREKLKLARRVVIKFGTNILLGDDLHPSKHRLTKLVAQIAALHAEGREIVLVSSGAIGSGMKVLGMTTRPKTLPELQMAASVGQSYLLSLYASLFEAHNIHIGQVLLTHDDLRNRVRHLNARNAFLASLKHRVIPIVNENDVVTVDEIRVGDNDVLASLVAMLIGAEALVLASTTDGFYSASAKGEKVRVPHISDVSDQHLSQAIGKGSEVSTGGMSTKLIAANNVAKMGAVSAIVDGRKDHDIVGVLSGIEVGTVIGSDRARSKVSKRKQWIAFFNRVSGSIVVDAGAKRALSKNNRSLLPIGIIGVKGNFGVGALIQIEDAHGEAVALGLCEYSSEEIDKIKGRSSAEVKRIFGPGHNDEVIHRDNIFTQA